MAASIAGPPSPLYSPYPPCPASLTQAPPGVRLPIPFPPSNENTMVPSGPTARKSPSTSIPAVIGSPIVRITPAVGSAGQPLAGGGGAAPLDTAWYCNALLVAAVPYVELQHEPPSAWSCAVTVPVRGSAPSPRASPFAFT